MTTILTMAYIIFVQPDGSIRRNLWQVYWHGFSFSYGSDMHLNRAGAGDSAGSLFFIYSELHWVSPTFKTSSKSGYSECFLLVAEIWGKYD